MLAPKPPQMFPRFLFAVICGYTIFALSLSLWGPIEYLDFTTDRKMMVAGFLLAFLGVTFVGMLLASWRPMPFRVDAERDEQRWITVVKGAIVVTFIVKMMLFAASAATQGAPQFDNPFMDVAQVYTDRKLQDEIQGNIFRQIDTFLTFVSWIAWIGGIHLWKKLGKVFPALLVIAVGVDLFYGLFYIGTQSSLMFYSLMALAYYLLKLSARFKPVSWRGVAVVAAAAITLFLVSAMVVEARLSLWGTESPEVTRAGFLINQEHWLVAVLPEFLRYSAALSSSYLSQGFYGLSLTLSIPFEWTQLMGSSRGLTSIVTQVMPSIPPVLDNTYPLRAEAEFGYPGLANWHTIFPWLASDFTFVGALIYFGLAAYLVTVCWQWFAHRNDVISAVFACLLVYQYIFVPANNQLFTSRGDALGCFVILAIWLWSGRHIASDAKSLPPALRPDAGGTMARVAQIRR